MFLLLECIFIVPSLIKNERHLYFSLFRYLAMGREWYTSAFFQMFAICHWDLRFRLSLLRQYLYYLLDIIYCTNEYVIKKIRKLFRKLFYETSHKYCTLQWMKITKKTKIFRFETKTRLQGFSYNVASNQIIIKVVLHNLKVILYSIYKVPVSLLGNISFVSFQQL